MQVLTVSADKSAKIWEITEAGNGNLKRTLSGTASTGSIDDMLVGCLWQKDRLITVSLGGMISLFAASNPDLPPICFSGHSKSVSSLTSFIQDGRRSIISSSYDGTIIKWLQGMGFVGKLKRKNNTQIKCFSVVGEEFIISGFDNKVHDCSCLFALKMFPCFHQCNC